MPDPPGASAAPVDIRRNIEQKRNQRNVNRVNGWREGDRGGAAALAPQYIERPGYRNDDQAGGERQSR